MIYHEKSVSDIKLAYIGGGSRGWAWGLMSDLASCDKISGTVYLYDIDYEAAQHNEIIGKKYAQVEGAKSVWDYKAVKTPAEALTDADFVIISILPGTFDEMESDVHAPEKYGIYQSVGDTSGPGGIVRAMRTIPMFEEIAGYIKEYCPNAWVINYTNPMTLCVKTLYRVFPEIKAFGCCHEVFDIQKILAKIVEDEFGVEKVDRHEIVINTLGVNHFTWVNKATYHNIDLFPYYKKFWEKYPDGINFYESEGNWFNKYFGTHELVKKDLFERFGVIAAAGDRHLAEFCEGKWYLASPERVAEMGFCLTPVSWRKQDLVNRLETSRKKVNGEMPVTIDKTGEEGVNQLCAILGLGEIVTNVNIPNRGQTPNLPIGAIVETNAVFRSDSVEPIFSGEIPASIHPMISRISTQQENISDAIAHRDVKRIFAAFINDPLVTCSIADAKKLFKEMCENTKEYLGMYDLSVLD